MTERSTPDRLLDSFEKLLVSEGLRGATLDAVAGDAEVSKGGLLYHFGNKDELVEAMLQRLREQGQVDVRKMRNSKKGPVEYYLSTSVNTGSRFDRALIATGRIAQENDERASAALAQMRDWWYEVLRESLGDESLARTIQLIGDGLYFDGSTGLNDRNAVQHVRLVLQRLGVLDSADTVEP